MNLPRQRSPISPEQIAAIVPPRPLVLEIGCNDGTDSEKLATIPGVKLHCFECDPRPLARFKARMGRLGPDRVTLHEYALGRENGRALFYQSGGTTKGAHLKDWDLSGSLKKPSGHKKRHAWCKFENTIEVETMTLDTWFSSYGFTSDESCTVDFLWLDVQGAEGDVFAGGVETLKRTRYVYCEFNDWKEPLYEGDLNFEQTLAALGSDWKPLSIYEGYNVLIQNTKVARTIPCRRSSGPKSIRGS